MSLYPNRPTFATVLRSFASGDGLPFDDVLAEQDIQDVRDAEGAAFGQGPEDVYTPAVTLWAFLAQCLSASKSCVAAVAILLEVLQVRIAVTQLQVGQKLELDQMLEPCPNLRDNDLSAFRVQIATEPLEVIAEQ